MPTDVNTFRDLELLNAKIDVWIDEEDYDEVYNCITLGTKSKVKRAIEEAFRDSSKFQSIFINEKGKDSNPQNAIQITDINNAEKKEKWKPLFFSKYLRAKIQEKGIDDYTKHLNDLVTYLQRKLPYPYPDPKNYQEIILQHLNFQELSACGKPGIESLGFAVQAYDLIVEKEGTENSSHFSFELYKLCAKLNQGIGFLHSEQKMNAALAFNEIIREFEDKAKCLQADEKGLWQSLLYDQAVLSRAELQEDLQFSYHTIRTLEKLNDRKKENKLIKEALAYRDMGRLTEAKNKIIVLLSPQHVKTQMESIDDIFGAFKRWEIRKKNIRSKVLGLLFDYYLLEFEDNEEKSQDNIEFFGKQFDFFKDEAIRSKTERVSYYQQLARFLRWLSDRYEKTRNDLYLGQIKQLYENVRMYLLPGKESKNVPMDRGAQLKDFDKYHYDRYTESMEKFYKNLTDCEFYWYKNDEQYLLGKLNEYEEKQFFLYKFKKLERDQRIRRLKNGLHEKDCQKPTKCFHEDPDSSSAFGDVLECSKKSTSSEENKSTEHKNITDFRGSQNFDMGFGPLIANDYETIMQRENDRFLDYLDCRSRHPIYYIPKGRVERSIHFMGLQRWNSQTPTLTLSLGGGYLLYEQDEDGKVTLGIAIDPGFDFVNKFFHMGFTLNDIDFILLSHAHLDHIRDFEPIVSSLLDLKKRKKDSNKKIHAMMTLGVYQHLEHVITNTILREFLADTYIIDIDEDIGPKEFLKPFSFRKCSASSKNKFESITLDDNSQKKCIEIRPRQAYHNDYSERSDSYGYIIKFYDDNNDLVFSFGYTGDTKWDKKIPVSYKDCDAVCIHLGALIVRDKDKGEKIENYKFERYKGDKCDALIEKKQHPYLFGLLRYLKKIQEGGNENKLLLISEFGEELKGGIRIDFIKRLNRLFEVTGKIPEETPVCLPVDIGLNLILAWNEVKRKPEDQSTDKEWRTGPPYKVWCYGCEKFVDSDKIRYRHFEHGNNDEALFYFCNVCFKSKPENAIQNKMRLICEGGLPLEKADE